MMYWIYAMVGLAGGVLTGMAGLTAAMVVTPMLCAVCQIEVHHESLICIRDLLLFIQSIPSFYFVPLLNKMQIFFICNSF